MKKILPGIEIENNWMGEGKGIFQNLFWTGKIITWLKILMYFRDYSILACRFFFITA